MIPPPINGNRPTSTSPQAAETASTWSLAAGLGALAILCALIWFGHTYHWVESAGGPERDAFVERADRVRAGAWPRDRFRPPLYVLVVAAAGAGFHTDSFSAARTVSSVAAVGLCLIAFALGRRIGDERAGLFAMAWTAVNPYVWLFGVQASTDMLFACLAALTLLCAVAYMQRPSAPVALATGVAYGLAAFTRANALFLLPSLAAVYLLAQPSAASRSMKHAATALVAAVVVFSPVWIIRWHVFGDPFYDENYRNFWWKLHGQLDPALLDAAPRLGILEVARQDPALVVRSAFNQVLFFGRRVLPSLVGNWLGMAILALAIVQTTRRRSTLWAYLVVSLGLFTLAVAVVFFPWDRFMLIWIPIAAALGAAAVLATFDTWRTGSRSRLIGSAVLLIAIATTAATTFGARVPEFISSHPYEEIALLQGVQDRVGAGHAAAGAAPFAQRYVRCRYVVIPEFEASGTGDFDRLEEWLRTNQVEFVAISDAELRSRPRWMLGGEGTAPSWLEPIEKTPHAMLWAVKLDSAR